MEENIVFATLAEKDLQMLSPIVLAYIGDSIYEVYIRRYILGKNKDCKVNDLHKKSTKYVKAKAQADAILGLRDFLSEEEWAVVKRGRNVKSHTTPKNAVLSDYKYATGYEALIGYLYMKNEIARVEEIVSKGISIIENIEQNKA